ncbi:hypothetical protein D9M68_809210 [compost metagenome]
MAHDGQELGLGPARGAGLGLGPHQVLGQLRHGLGAALVDGHPGLEHVQPGPDPDVAAARDDDEALQQGPQPRRIHRLEQDVGRGVGLDHHGGGVHQRRDRAPGVEGASELGRQLQGEGVALDQADGPAVGVGHGDDQGRGLGLEPGQGLGPRRVRRHGRRGVHEVSDPGHSRAPPPLRERG